MTLPTTMSAVLLTDHGGLEKLEYRTDVPRRDRQALPKKSPKVTRAFSSKSGDAQSTLTLKLSTKSGNALEIVG